MGIFFLKKRDKPNKNNDKKDVWYNESKRIALKFVADILNEKAFNNNKDMLTKSPRKGHSLFLLKMVLFQEEKNI